MRPPPPLWTLPQYPIVGGTALLAIGVTLAFHSGISVDPLFLDPRLPRGEVWRLITSVLPHVDVFHLLFNLYWLWVLGSLVEATFGHLRTLALIGLLAAGSGAAEWAVLEGGVGLSGVGYGLWAMCGVLGRRDTCFADAADRQTHIAFIAWFFLCIVTTVTGLMPVGNIAHGVGAALGASIGLAISMPFRRPLIAGAVGVFLLLTIAAATAGRPWVNMSPRRGDAEAWLAYTRQTDNRNEEAVAWYRAALRMRQEPSWWFNLGIAYHTLGSHAEALDAYRRANELAPDSEDYRNAYTSLRAAYGDPIHEHGAPPTTPSAP